MKKHTFGLLLLVLTAALTGCAGMKAKTEPMAFNPAMLEAGEYTPKVDNFQFILDASYSIGDECQKDFRTAKNVISGINQSLPKELSFTGGLRTFGHHRKQSKLPTELVYGMREYSREGLAQGLKRVNYTGGNSPLPGAIKAAGEDLKELHGKSAVIIVSDGQKKLEMAGAPEAAAKLKEEMGNRLCIYMISVGGDPAGEKFLQEVAKASDCGFSVNAASLTSSASMASFVEKVFLTSKLAPGPVDSDGDGVIDARDRCPGTARGVQVDERGCPRDSDGDGDGVIDARDRCPDTAKGVQVDERGCPRDSDGDGVSDYLDKCPNTPEGEFVDDEGCTLKLTLRINFEFDEAEVEPEFKPELQRAANFIKKYDEVPIFLIEGHTDSVGEKSYNQNLSMRRAKAVRQYLIENFSINPGRLVARGMGESQPIATNETAAGRYKNRRVEIICCVVPPPVE